MSIHYSLQGPGGEDASWFSNRPMPDNAFVAGTVAEAVATHIYYQDRHIDWWPITIYLFSESEDGDSLVFRWEVKIDLNEIPKFSATHVQGASSA
jgi:hypothetical protein